MNFPEILISTDTLGLFGDWPMINKLWDPKFHFKKVEMIGFSSKINHLLKTKDKYGYEIGEIHGQMNSRIQFLFKSLPMWLINQTLISTPVLLNRYSKYEILLHTPEARKYFRLIISNNNLKRIWIENHTYGATGALQALKLIEKINLKKPNLAGLMFDLCHFIGGANLQNKNFKSNWKMALNFLISLKDKQIPIGIHFPVGTLTYDSLPINEEILTDEMLSDFANLIHDEKLNIAKIVLESQHGKIFALNPTFAKIAQIRTHHDQAVERLIKTGIIKLV